MPFLHSCWTLRSCNKTSEKIKQKFYLPGLQEDAKMFVSRCQNGMTDTFGIFNWWNGNLHIFFTTLEVISYDLCHCQIETNIYLSLEIALQNGTKQYHDQIKQLLQLQMPCLSTQASWFSRTKF